MSDTNDIAEFFLLIRREVAATVLVSQLIHAALFALAELQTVLPSQTQTLAFQAVGW